MKFKVGDEVRVREDLEVNKIYNDFIFVPDMKKQKSKIVKITQVSDNTNSYRIMEDLERYFWTDEMLEPIEKERKEMNIEELNLEYKNKMDMLMEEYRDKVKEIAEEEEPFIKEGQGYFTIDNYFRILTTKNFDCEDDVERIQIGNCYPFTDENEKEVKLIAERRKLQSEMEMFARLNDKGEIDWDNIAQKKWYLYIDHSNNNEIAVGYNHYFRELNTTYFTSKEIAQKALKKFGDRIRELYINNKESIGNE